jgi:hypothetical protein
MGMKGGATKECSGSLGQTDMGVRHKQWWQPPDTRYLVPFPSDVV